MDNNWATEHIQVIRTLMERSALYRRALAPIMTFAGVVGLIAAVIGWLANIDSARGFIGYWFAVSFVGLTGALLLVRRQALKAAESFWSPPTRRVAQAAFPPLLSGLIIGWTCFGCLDGGEIQPLLLVIWVVLYGCGLHAAGLFTSRGLRVLGWLFILAGAGLFLGVLKAFPEGRQCHLVMGALFGALQLACGIYLYFTERLSSQP
jgi:hypothetical protein